MIVRVNVDLNNPVVVDITENSWTGHHSQTRKHRLTNPEPRTGKSIEKWVKSREMSQFLVKELSVEVMGIGSHYLTLKLEK